MTVDISGKEKALVIARLKSSNQSRKLSVMAPDGIKTYTIKDIVKNIESDSEMGKRYVQEQMDFMRRINSGEVYKLIEEIENL